jgi:hypothetical protein
MKVLEGPQRFTASCQKCAARVEYGHMDVENGSWVCPCCAEKNVHRVPRSAFHTSGIVSYGR